MFINKYGGTNDAPGCDKRIYNLWYQMLRRCYDDTQQERSRGKSYANCNVSKRWMKLSNFVKDLPTLPGYNEWINSREYCLDKDMIKPGNKTYGKRYCSFVTKDENVRDIYRRNPHVMDAAYEANKVKYALTKNNETIVFDSAKEACEYLGVGPSTVTSCYVKGYKCKGYKLERLGSRGSK